MILTPQEKGRIGEAQISATLTSLAPEVSSVCQVPNEQDDGHYDLFFAIHAGTRQLRAQVKYLSELESTLRISATHMRDWLRADLPTVLFWWDMVHRCAFWSDPARKLLTLDKGITGESVLFDRTADLKALDTDDRGNREAFLAHMTFLSECWSSFRHRESTFVPIDHQYPVSFSNLLQNPIMAAYLPVEREIADYILRLPSAPSRRIVERALLTLCSHCACADSENTARDLLRQLHIREDSRRIIHFLSEKLEAWHTRATTLSPSSESVLCGYDTIRQLLSTPTDLPRLTFTQAFPATKLLRLFPREFVVSHLLSLMETANTPDVIWAAAHFLRSLDLPADCGLADEVRRLDSRIATLPLTDTDRLILIEQLTYTEAALGGEASVAKLLTYLRDTAFREVLNDFHSRYYESDHKRVAVIAQLRASLESPAERLLRAVNGIIYGDLREFRHHPVDRLNAASRQWLNATFG